MENIDKYKELRERAEETLQNKINIEKLEPSEIKKIVHDLEVYQIELELQNEELNQRNEEYKLLKNKFQDLYDYAPVGYISLNENNEIIEANDEFSQIIQSYPEDFIGKRFDSYIHSDFQDRWYLIEKKAKESKFSESEEIKLKNGSFLKININNSTDYLLVTLTDISEKYIAEEKYRTIIEATDMLVTQVDSSGEMIYANSKSSHFFGLEPEECIGRSAYDFVHIDDKKKTEEYFSEWLESEEENFEFENRLCSVFGVVHYMKWSINKVKSNSGEISGFSGIALDITPIKEAQEKIIEQNQLLLKQEEDLKNSIESREVLLKEIHHRVKNNLETISSLLFQQKILSKDKKVMEALNDSMSRVSSMALIHQFIYRSDDLENINMNDYINELVAKLTIAYQYEKNGISMSIDVDDIYFDIDRTIPLALVINEVFTNIFKYAFKDGRTGSVKIFMKKIETEKIKLVISDTGVGFPVEFNPDKTKTLGIYLIKNLIKRQLKGDIKITSKPEVGVQYEMIL